MSQQSLIWNLVREEVISATEMTWASDIWGEAEGAGPGQPGEGSAGLVSVWCRESGARLSSVVPSEDKKQRAPAETWEIPFKHKKTLFYCDVIEHWNASHKEVVESSSLETFKTHLAIALSKLLLLTLFGARGLG